MFIVKSTFSTTLQQKKLDMHDQGLLSFSHEELQYFFGCCIHDFLIKIGDDRPGWQTL